jgi:hypothetical protein
MAAGCRWILGTGAWASGMLLVAASCECMSLVDVIPPRSMTDTSLDVTYIRIEDFWNQHGRVPKTPDELPDIPQKDCSMKDGWHRELHWESDGVSTVRVWSLGRDGQPGGTGEDADSEVVFVGKQKHQHDHPEVRATDVRP